jgi:hypothetical protein
VKLESIGAVTPAKSLLLAGIGARQLHGAGRKIVGIAMPLEHRGTFTQHPKYRILESGGSGVQVIPADFVALMTPHWCAEYMRQ